MSDAPPRARLDVWLWRARFFKTRALAAQAAGKGLRLNGRKSAKPGAGVKPGDRLSFAQGGRVRVVEILDLGERRGPAAEAQALYRDLDAPDSLAAPPATH